MFSESPNLRDAHLGLELLIPVPGDDTSEVHRGRPAPHHAAAMHQYLEHRVTTRGFRFSVGQLIVTGLDERYQLVEFLQDQALESVFTGGVLHPIEATVNTLPRDLRQTVRGTRRRTKTHHIGHPEGLTTGSLGSLGLDFGVRKRNAANREWPIALKA